MNKSFTLIEILVVIVIIGILSAFIIVSMAGVSDKANIAKSQAFSNSLKNALLMNLVSEWKFDELATATNGATVADTWGGGNNGTLITADANDKLRTGTSCVSGKCLELDGTDDYVDFGNSDSLNNITEYVISFWVKTSQAPGSTVHLIWKENAPWKYIGVNLLTNGRIEFRLYDGTANPAVQTAVSLNDNKYHYIVATRKSGKIYVYRDTIVAEATDTTSSYVTTQKLIVGTGYGSGGAGPLNGYIDDLRIFNAGLPASKIKENYYSGLNKLLVNNGFGIVEYGQRLGELKINLTRHE
jgi:prepilin-type N-terminal cleavage/methylation domain-containing protein